MKRLGLLVTSAVIALCSAWAGAAFAQAPYAGAYYGPPGGPSAMGGPYAMAPANYWQTEPVVGAGAQSFGGDTGGCASCGCGHCGGSGGDGPLSRRHWRPDRYLGCAEGECGGEGMEGGLGGGMGGGEGGDGDGNGLRPRWFNISMELVNLTRENISRPIDFMTEGSRDPIAGDPFNPVALSTGSLDFKEKPGIRVTGQFICGPGGDLEFTYLGTFLFTANARVTSAANLFSAFSGFGTAPVIGFLDTDSATAATLNYSSRFDSGELNYRRRFESPNNRIQNSWLVGMRYIRLDESMLLNTVSTNTLNYNVKTNNDLTGFQIGGDMTVSVNRWITLGGELKAGLYGNHSEQRTNINSNLGALAVTESASHDGAAFAAESNWQVIVFCGEHVSLRTGYNLMYMDRVALAPENFNSTRNTNGTFSNRLVTIDQTGHAFMHGLTAGAEITW